MRLNKVLAFLTFVVVFGFFAQTVSAYYSPEVGRFISRDPIGYEAEDANLYRYVGNQSQIASDPLGEEPWLMPWDKNACRNPIKTCKFWFSHSPLEHYRGLFTTDTDYIPDISEAAWVAAGDHISTHSSCILDANKQIVALLAGGTAGITDASVVLPFPKWLAVTLGLERGTGASPFTSIARIISNSKTKCIPDSVKEYMLNLSNEIKNRPGQIPRGKNPTTPVKEIIRRMKRSGAVGITAMETLINIYCLEKEGVTDFF
jgi:hypothetical protein